jgi:Fe2+ transport system protein FeoA
MDGGTSTWRMALLEGAKKVTGTNYGTLKRDSRPEAHSWRHAANSTLPRRRSLPTLPRTVKKHTHSRPAADGCCTDPAVCPLSQVKAGTVVCIKRLVTSPEMGDRLRELGLGEDQRVKLILQNDSVICQVCNARVALSQELARAILVEPVAS